MTLTFRSLLTDTFKLDKKINFTCAVESNQRDSPLIHRFFVSKRELANMPFDAIIGKDLLARLNVVISFGRNIVGVNIADDVQLTEDDEITDAALDTDLDRNEFICQLLHQLSISFKSMIPMNILY